MSHDLLIPIECLPGPVPVGAPVFTDDGVSGIVMGHSLGSVLICTGETSAWRPSSRARLALSRPSTIDDWPARIDGADVAAALLARAMGLDPAGGVIFQLAGDSRRSDLFNPSPLLILWLLSTCSGDVEFSGEDIPALADIDPQDPDADRLALAAVIRSKPWRK